MLEASKAQMEAATVERTQLAHIIARAYMTSELEENLMPVEKAAEIIEEHCRSNTESWKRSVKAALSSIQTAEDHGYRLTEGPTERQPGAEMSSTR